MVKLTIVRRFLEIGIILERHPLMGKPSKNDLLPNIHSTLCWLLPLENLAHSSHETMRVPHTVGFVVFVADFGAFFEKFPPHSVSLSYPLSILGFNKCLQCPIAEVGLS